MKTFFQFLFISFVFIKITGCSAQTIPKPHENVQLIYFIGIEGHLNEIKLDANDPDENPHAFDTEWIKMVKVVKDHDEKIKYGIGQDGKEVVVIQLKQEAVKLVPEKLQKRLKTIS